MNYQVIGLGGHLTNDVRVGEKAVNFSVAVNSGYGENKRVAFVSCVAFKAFFHEKLWARLLTAKKGDVMEVKGELYTDSREKDGNKISELRLLVKEFSTFAKTSDGTKAEKAPAKAKAPAPQEESDDVPF